MANPLLAGFRSIASGSVFEVQRGTTGEIDFIQNASGGNVRICVNRIGSSTATGIRLLLLKPGDFLQVSNGDTVTFHDPGDFSMLERSDVARVLGAPVGTVVTNEAVEPPQTKPNTWYKGDPVHRPGGGRFPLPEYNT